MDAERRGGRSTECFSSSVVCHSGCLGPCRWEPPAKEGSIRLVWSGARPDATSSLSAKRLHRSLRLILAKRSLHLIGQGLGEIG